jgi:hypothetical protein
MKPGILFFMVATASGLSTNGYATGVAGHLSASVEHSIGSVAHLSAGTAKAISASTAMPLKAVGAIGAASAEMGDALWDEANRPIGEPLPIDDTIHTVGPRPDEALRGVPRE